VEDNQKSPYEIILDLGRRLNLPSSELAELILAAERWTQDLYQRGVKVGYRSGDDPNGTKYIREIAPELWEHK
jgi:hypothetical protein